MKKKLIFTMLSVFILPNVIFAQDNKVFTTDFGKELSASEYEKMQSFGYDDDLLSKMPTEAIERYLSEEMTLVSEEAHYIQSIYTYSNSDMKNYCGNNCSLEDVKEGAVPLLVEDYEISEESYNQQKTENSIMPFANTTKYSTTQVFGSRKLEVRTFYIPESNTFKLVNAVMWDGVPDRKSFDINALFFTTPGAVIVNDSQYAFQTYVQYGLTGKETKDVSYTTHSDHYKFHANGIGITMNLADGDKFKGTRDHVLYLEYQVKKSITNKINTFQVKASYTHATSAVSLSDFVGILLSSEPTGNFAALGTSFGIAILVTNYARDKYQEPNVANLICTNLDW